MSKQLLGFVFAAIVGGMTVGSAHAAIIEVEPNDSLADAQVLPSPAAPFADVVLASLDSNDDFDIYQIDLDVDEVLSVITTPLRVFGQTPDTMVGVVGPSDEYLVTNDDAGEDNPSSDEFGSSVRLFVDTPGTYFVVVTGFDDLPATGDLFDIAELGDDSHDVGEYSMTYSVTAIPEPASLLLMGAALPMIAARRRRA